MPKTKAYRDPLYEADGAVNNAAYAQWLDGPEQAPAPAAAPAANAAAAVAARPNTPANADQHAWNQRIIHDIEFRLQHAALPAEVHDQIEMLLNIARAEQVNIPEGGPAQIDINLINALAAYAVASPAQLHPRRHLIEGVTLGGGRVFRAIDPDLGPHITAEHVAALKSYIVTNIPAQAGGHRNSFKRRRGKTPKKTRYTRRS